VSELHTGTGCRRALGKASEVRGSFHLCFHGVASRSKKEEKTERKIKIG